MARLALPARDAGAPPRGRGDDAPSRRCVHGGARADDLAHTCALGGDQSQASLVASGARATLIRTGAYRTSWQVPRAHAAADPPWHVSPAEYAFLNVSPPQAGQRQTGDWQ